MPRKRGRPKVNAALQSKQEEPRDVNQEEDGSSELIDLAERQGEAIRAFQAVQIEQLRTMLRLLRSSFSKEEPSVPVLHFFSKNLPNLVLVRNKNDNACEVQWKKDDGSSTMEQLDQMHVPTSLLQRLSRMYSHRSSVIPPFDRFGFSNNSVKTCVFGAENLQIKGLVLEEPSENQLVDQQDPFQTPGFQENGNRLSVGVTPKTLRFPKHGEMLLSVHGSPLGVYKEDMESIHESQEH